MQYNSYNDVNVDQLVGDPLDTGVTQSSDVADQGKLSDKELNFRALREEAAKFKEEREYWKGQAEALNRNALQIQPAPQQAPQIKQEDAYAALDWEDPRDVRKAFEQVQQENTRIRSEFKDALAAVETKAVRQDWNKMVTQHVPQLTSQNPIFAEMIQNASNPYEAAYLLAELNSKATMQPAPANFPHENGNGQRALNNAHKPQTLASVGGQGQLSSADYYANMSDQDFMKIAAKNLANI
jgi:hypothetical protein